MGISLEVKTVSLKTPEQVDKVIQFLSLYKELNFGISTPVKATPPSVPMAKNELTLVETPTSEETAAVTSAEERKVSRSVPFSVIMTEKRGIARPPQGEQSVDYIHKVLKANPAGLMLDELIAAIRQVGWSTTITSPTTVRGTINKTLRRHEKRFEQLSNGRWALSGTQSAQKDLSLLNS